MTFWTILTASTRQSSALSGLERPPTQYLPRQGGGDDHDVVRWMIQVKQAQRRLRPRGWVW